MQEILQQEWFIREIVPFGWFSEMEAVQHWLKKENLSSHFILRTDGSGADHLIIPAGGSRKPISKETSLPIEMEDGNIRNEETVRMNGMEIMSFALREIPPMVEELLDQTGWRKDEVGTYALHQANAFMLEYLRKKMKLQKPVVPIAVSDVVIRSSIHPFDVMYKT